jgi:hypothetical protein
MPSNFSTTIYIDDGGVISWSVCYRSSATGGVNRRMLEQDQSVWSLIGHDFGMEIALNFQRTLIID